MRLQLRDGLHWCNCEGRAVFLDTLADRYFELPFAANEAFLRLASAAMQTGDPERLEPMIARGLLVARDSSSPFEPPPAISAPSHDFPGIGGGPAAMMRALLAELRAARMLRRKPFHEVLDEVRAKARPAALPADADRALGRIVSAAANLAYVTRSHDRCLVRALAVHSLCKRRGLASKLVIGVVANPFAAHCWVQAGNAVLVGGFEQARLYTPILVTE